MSSFLKFFLVLTFFNVNYAQNWFPAEVGNQILQRCTVFDHNWGNVRKFFSTKIEKDTLIDNQKYFLVRNSDYLSSNTIEEKWFRYDQDSQKFFWRVLDTSVVYMDFNIPAGQQFPQHNPITGITSYRTVFESSKNLFGNIYTVKGFEDWEFSNLMRKWIDSFGIEPLGIYDKRIEQVLQYKNSDTIYFEYGYKPDFSYFSPILETNSLNFNYDFWVDHFYIQNNGSVFVDFIDSIFFDCYYKSNTDSLPVERIYAHNVYTPYPKRRINFNLNQFLMSNGYSFFYKVTAKDKGIIPNYNYSPDTGYYKLEYLTTWVENEKKIPLQFSLSQNYPNPFNPTTKIKYTVPQTPLPFGKGQGVRLIVYDVLGNEVTTLVNDERAPGVYEVEFQSAAGNRQLASGVYYYQLKAGSYVETKKMIYLK